MNQQAALLALLSGHGLAWQTEPTNYQTKKGKDKVCAQALINGQVFWRHWRSDSGELRSIVRLAGAWLVRSQKNQWALLVALKPSTIATLAVKINLQLPGAGVASEQIGENPF